MSREHRIGMRALRARLASVLTEVDGGESYVVERNGEPVAAVVPLQLYRRLVGSVGEAPRGVGRVAETARGPYDALLALAGTMPSEHTDVGRHKRRHLGEIYATKKRRP